MTERTSRSASKLGVILAIAVALAAAAWLGFEVMQRFTGQPLSPEDFDRRIRTYLLQNPEVIVSALRSYEEQQRTAATDEVRALVAAHRDEVFNDSSAPVGGNPEGDATLVEFFDYNCPYCRRIAPVLVEAESKDPDLRIVYKEWPILGPNSEFAARAALAAHRQGKYVAFHRAMMEANGQIDKDKVMDTAQAVGLDLERLKADMNDPAIQEVIDRNLELARVLRITGTPSFVVGEEIIRGAVPLSDLQNAIVRARQPE